MIVKEGGANESPGLQNVDVKVQQGSVQVSQFVDAARAGKSTVGSSLLRTFEQ